MSVSRGLVRVLLGVGMVGAGVSHLTVAREEFQAQVPSWFPIDEDVTVLASGVVEVALGAAFVALPARRRLIGALLGGFYIAVFPGNIAQYAEHRDAFGLDTESRRFARLFFQPVLVAAALYGGGMLGRRPSRRS